MGGVKLLISIIVISLIGTLAHFLYDLSGHNKIVGLFASVNESTWEHIKIALTPTFLWSLLDGYLYGGNPNYFLAKFICLLSIIIVIPLIFYSYRLFVKKSIALFDILIFYVSIIISQVLFRYILGLSPLDYIYNYLGCVGVFILFGSYLLLTLLPLELFVFKDPNSNKYGFKGHRYYKY